MDAARSACGPATLATVRREAQRIVPDPSPTTVDTSADGEDPIVRRPKHVIRICTLEPCYTAADRELTEMLEARLGLGLDERSADGSIRFEALECIGLCDIGEAVTIDDLPVIGRRAVMQATDDILG